jgi:hypothetical protein
MNHIFNNSRIPDDKTIIDNLEEFKIMLEAQRFYCYQCQCDIATLNANYNKKKEKYKKLKNDIIQLIEKNHEYKNEICNLKLQLEFFNKMSISPVNFVNQNNYLQMNTNNQIQIPIPPPPPPPVCLNKVQPNNIMSDLIKELKSKIKPFDN